MVETYGECKVGMDRTLVQEGRKLMTECSLETSVTTMGRPKKLRAGDMLYLAAGEAHDFEAVEDSSFLLTITTQSGETTT